MEKIITDRVKTVEDAFSVLNLTMLMPDVSILPERDARRIISYYSLIKIIEALNEGWYPSEGDGGYVPWWLIEWPGGIAAFVSANAYNAPSIASTSVGGGFRFRLKTRSLAVYAAKQFKDLWENIFL